MRRYSIEPRTRKYVKRYGFLSFARKYRKQLLDTGLDDDNIGKQEPVKEIIISPKKKIDEILNELKKVS